MAGNIHVYCCHNQPKVVNDFSKKKNPRTVATRIEDYYKEDEDSYKKRILKMGKMKTVEKTRKMKKVKTRKIYKFN